MADGSVRGQREFHFPRRAIASALRPGEIVADLFAGGGGASEALRQALGRDPDIAINHDEWAIAMHAANHPFTSHYREDVWHADPRQLCAGRPVGWLHASPDCTHFSQAKGGQPRSRATRALSWVVVKWAGTVRPRIISLENVEQILKWTGLVAKRDKATGRVVRLDGTIAAPGERVPVEQQFLIPDKRREGHIWQAFVASLRALGYVVEWRKVRACDYGAGTTRTRLFMIARCDGEPIRWPAPTHGDGLTPFVTAADCIDWSIPCPSIFDRRKPLAEATMRRIARGIQKFVLGAAEPFIVPNNTNNVPKGASEPLPAVTTCQGRNLLVTPMLVQAAHGEGDGPTKRRSSGAHDIREPVGTIHAGGGSFALASASLVKFRGDSPGSAASDPMPTITSGAGSARPAGCAHALGVMTAHLTALAQNVTGSSMEKPVPTVLAGATRFGVVSAFLEQAAGGPNSNTSPPRAADEPLSTIMSSGAQQRLVTANMVTLRRNCVGAGADEPLRVIAAAAEHHAIVECTLSAEQQAGAERVAAFLMRYYGEGGQHGDVRAPAATVTTKDRLALVTVTVRGTPYVIVDIGLRMLRREELYRAQGFPADYIIDRTADGRPISGTRAVRMVGNSVSPPPLAVIARANLGLAIEYREAA